MTTIDRIMSKIENLIYDTKYNEVRQILETELTAVKGVDELIEKITEKAVFLQNYVEHKGAKEFIDGIISDLKSIKQTPSISPDAVRALREKYKNMFGPTVGVLDVANDLDALLLK